MSVSTHKTVVEVGRWRARTGGLVGTDESGSSASDRTLGHLYRKAFTRTVVRKSSDVVLPPSPPHTTCPSLPRFVSSTVGVRYGPCLRPTRLDVTEEGRKM